MSRDNKIKEEIRDYWFKDHKAILDTYGNLKVLAWKNPTSNSYYIKYIFDGHKIYISGDVGDAIFTFTSNVDIHSFDDMPCGYFLSKMTTCSNGEYEFDGCKAKNRLEQWKDELLKRKEFYDKAEKESFVKTINNMAEDAFSCDSEEQWAWEFVNNKYSEFISENELDYHEWIYTIGNAIPYHNFAFLIGLQMASKQIKYEV